MFAFRRARYKEVEKDLDKVRQDQAALQNEHGVRNISFNTADGKMENFTQ